VSLVDSGEETARAVAGMLGSPGALSGRAEGGTLRCYVSDNPQRFSEVGSRFLAESIREVRWISPEEFFEGGRAAKDVAVGVG
jgi:glutamate racemase